MVRDGRYGRAPGRQRYRCTDAASGRFHRFTPPLPREGTEGGVCPTCDTHVAAHAAPVVSRHYEHRLHLVADALVAVGRGVPYAAAAQRARVAAGRPLVMGSEGGQLVAEWVDAWAPAALQALPTPDVVETLVLDSTESTWTNRRTGTRRREFAVLVAYGYLPGGGRRVLAARASVTALTADWLELLADLHLRVPPTSVVADDAPAIRAAVARMWPVPLRDIPYLFACEHHLRQRARAALAVDKADAPRGRWGRRLDTAFRRPEGWEEFARACAPLGGAAAWVKANGPLIAGQVAVRSQLPAHYSTAGAEAAVHRLREMLEKRSFALRNATRTNLLLALAVAHLNNEDDATRYHRNLREHAEASGGPAPARQRVNRDQDHDPATGPRRSSLR